MDPIIQIVKLYPSDNEQRQTIHKLQIATIWDIYRGNKKNGISGILAIFLFNPSWLPTLLKI